MEVEITKRGDNNSARLQSETRSGWSPVGSDQHDEINGSRLRVTGSDLRVVLGAFLSGWGKCEM